MDVQIDEIVSEVPNGNASPPVASGSPADAEAIKRQILSDPLFWDQVTRRVIAELQERWRR